MSGKKWLGNVQVYQEQIADLERQLAEARRASRTRPDYDLRCQDCGAPHWLDTSLPSVIWNQIAKPGDILCLLCIDNRLQAKGLTCNEAEFYFVGAALSSKLYAESHGNVQNLQRQLAEARAEVERLRKALRRIQDMSGVAYDFQRVAECALAATPPSEAREGE